jgi:predicted PurR-regulated permease PerM
MNDDESRLVRIEDKLDNLISQLHNLKIIDARQEIRIEQLAERVEQHGKTLERYFQRLETLENQPAKTALKLWGKIGSISLSVIVTAIITFVLVYFGVKK